MNPPQHRRNPRRPGSITRALLLLIRAVGVISLQPSCHFGQPCKTPKRSPSADANHHHGRAWQFLLSSNNEAQADDPYYEVEEAQPTATTSDNTQDDDDDVGAPFVRTYPRYRVDLTRVPRADQVWQTKKQNALFRVFEPSPDSIRRKLQSHYRTLFPQAIITVVNKGDTTTDAYPTCHAMWELWEAAARVQQQQQSASTVVAFADPALAGVARNFVDLVDWATHEEPSLASAFGVRAEYLEDDNDSSPRAAVHLYADPHAELDNTRAATAAAENEEETVNARTQAWVQRLLVELGICPFTKTSKRSGQGLQQQGVPVGRIAYHAFFATAPSCLAQSLCPLLAKTWEAMYEMLVAGPGPAKPGISSILLAAPAWDDDFDAWAGPVFALLEASVVAAQAEAWLGVVCFHPRYAVSDGSSWPGFGHMHSVPRLQQWVQESEEHEAERDACAAGGAWQRRTPHATINVLRADQLAVAEQVRSTTTLYPRNIAVLMELGSAQLQRDLQRERQMGSTSSLSD